MTPEEFTEVFDEIAEAPEGIERLRELVLQLAVRGRLVPQDANEEPASVLLERIADEKFRLFREGKLRIPKPVPPIATDEAPFEIPDHWEWVRLGDITNSRLGKMLDKSKNKGPYRRYLRNANVQWFRFDLSDVLELRLEDAELEEYSVKENDLIVCEGGEPGRAAVCGPDVDGMVFQKALHRVRPWCGISTWYLAYLLRCDTWSQRINTLFTGATIKHLTGKALATHMVPLPPLSEQYRIVSKVDELMGLIDQLVAARRSREAVRTAARDSVLAALRNAATPEDGQAAWTRITERMDDLFAIPADLAPLREAVLQLAVRGKLVPQDLNDEPASESLKRIAAVKARTARKGRVKVRKVVDPTLTRLNYHLPSSWASAHLSDLTQVLNGRAYKKNELLPEGTPVLRVGNLFTSNQWYHSDLDLDEDKYCEEGDLIYAWSASFGPFIWRGPKVIYHYHIWKLSLFSETNLMKQFLYNFLLQKTQDIKNAGHGISMVHMTKEKMEQLIVPLPPLAEQRRIVAKVDELMGLIDRLEQHLVAKREYHEAFAAAATNVV